MPEILIHWTVDIRVQQKKHLLDEAFFYATDYEDYKRGQRAR